MAEVFVPVAVNGRTPLVGKHSSQWRGAPVHSVVPKARPHPDHSSGFAWAALAACTSAAAAAIARHGRATRVKRSAKGGESQCPFHTNKVVTNKEWWPNQLNLEPLEKSNPTAGLTSYAEEFKKLDLEAVKQDLFALMTDSQDWWPADFGHYGPFFVRMAWHSAGTYRTIDGRGGGGHGNMRFAPLNSWPDNGNLDKARRLLWPIKKKYGRKLSWGDLMILAGNCAIESMGLKPFGFAGGREDIWEPESDVYWGSESEWLGADRGGLGADLEKPLGAVQMGLIYVNPEGPGGKPDVAAAAQDIRETFGRMAMNDEETVALIAGGHTFGKAHGAADPGTYVGPEPEGGSIEEQGFGWTNTFNSGKGADTITSGLEGAWTSNPAKWDNEYLDNLFGYDWEQTKSPAGATQWMPTDKSAHDKVPDAHVEGKKHPPMMFTTDLALKEDPSYRTISELFQKEPAEFGEAFAKAWYKLTHRDMGPHARLLGSDVPPPQIWQDPVPTVTGSQIGDAEIAELKKEVLSSSGASRAQLVRTAWASACTFRGTDFRGGANGARICLAPQKDWAVNDPTDLAGVLKGLADVQKAFNAKGGGQVSMADLIVLAGGAAIEEAAKAAGHDVSVPFTPGRTDATDEQTDAESFAVLEPTADGFRNFAQSGLAAPPEAMLVDRAHMLSLSKAEMTVLVGGLRVLGATSGDSNLGVFTESPGTLTNDFFVSLLDMDTVWSPADGSEQVYEGKDRATGELKWKGSRVDLVFGSNSELRSLAEYYACDDAEPFFITDFVTAWTKVMELDRFDI